jgi:hypothetical protein
MRQRKRDGFTLIELMLAMTFVSILLIAIALLTIYVSNLYTRGITLRQVNEAGLAVSSDLERTIQDSAVFDITPGKANFIVQKDGVDDAGGRLCLGKYSYAWNFGKVITKYPSNLASLPNYFIKKPDLVTPVGPVVRFVKIVDFNKDLCRPTNPAQVALGLPAAYGGIDNDPKSTVELLASGDRDLALQAFSLKGSSQKKLYSISLTISTNDQTAIDTATGQCRPPASSQGDPDYCAVNNFDIVARTGN